MVEYNSMKSQTEPVLQKVNACFLFYFHLLKEEFLMSAIYLSVFSSHLLAFLIGFDSKQLHENLHME